LLQNNKKKYYLVKEGKKERISKKQKIEKYLKKKE
jgi:hypothetical protein